MAIYTIKELRDNLDILLDRADAGEEVIIRRGKSNYYKIIRLHKNSDEVLSKEELASIKRGIEDIENGRTYRMQSDEDLSTFLDRTDASNE